MNVLHHCKICEFFANFWWVQTLLTHFLFVLSEQELHFIDTSNCYGAINTLGHKSSWKRTHGTTWSIMAIMSIIITHDTSAACKASWPLCTYEETSMRPPSIHCTDVLDPHHTMNTFYHYYRWEWYNKFYQYMILSGEHHK